MARQATPGDKTQEQSVYDAIVWAVGNTVAGHLSSIEELRQRACLIYGRDSISRVTVCKFRSDWRRANNIEADGRTHRDVPRRSMLKDGYASLALVVELDKFLKDSRRLTAQRFAGFLDKAKAKGLHSLEQLQEVSANLTEFRNEARNAA